MTDCVESYFLSSSDEKLKLIKSLVQQDDIKSLYGLLFKSDIGEKIFLLDQLSRLDTQGSFKQIFTEALRTNASELFKFVALELDYPGYFFDIAEYNQMVLKALFLELDLSQMKHLKKRKNPLLDQMIADYKEERELANREVPAGIDFYRSLV